MRKSVAFTHIKSRCSVDIHFAACGHTARVEVVKLLEELMNLSIWELDRCNYLTVND